MSDGFYKVNVTVIANPDGSFSATYLPEIIRVTANDSVLSFLLSNDTDPAIQIISVAVRQTENDQISEATISTNGRQAIVSDINTLKAKFNLDFQFSNGKLEVKEGAAALNRAISTDWPEIDNVPP